MNLDIYTLWLHVNGHEEYAGNYLTEQDARDAIPAGFDARIEHLVVKGQPLSEIPPLPEDSTRPPLQLFIPGDGFVDVNELTDEQLDRNRQFLGICSRKAVQP